MASWHRCLCTSARMTEPVVTGNRNGCSFIISYAILDDLCLCSFRWRKRKPHSHVIKNTLVWYAIAINRESRGSTFPFPSGVHYVASILRNQLHTMDLIYQGEIKYFLLFFSSLPLSRSLSLSLLRFSHCHPFRLLLGSKSVLIISFNCGQLDAKSVEFDQFIHQCDRETSRDSRKARHRRDLKRFAGPRLKSFRSGLSPN